MTGPQKDLFVRIERFVDDSFPGWVECDFTGANGRRHIIVDKVPMFTSEMLDSTSSYPKAGSVLCRVLEELRDEQGRELVRITTPPLESTEGLSNFIVLRTQLSD